MIKEYEAEEHFKTYAFERNPSFSANCNALNALLSMESRLQDYRAQIEKVLLFLRRTWWEADRSINDKWVQQTRTLVLPRILTVDRI